MFPLHNKHSIIVNFTSFAECSTRQRHSNLLASYRRGLHFSPCLNALFDSNTTLITILLAVVFGYIVCGWRGPSDLTKKKEKVASGLGVLGRGRRRDWEDERRKWSSRASRFICPTFPHRLLRHLQRRTHVLLFVV